MATTFRKTAKGLAEIETRAHRLPPRLRSALIVVDGRRAGAALSQLIPQQADETLASLLEQGFIEAIEAQAPAAVRAVAAPAPAPSSAPKAAPAGFEERRRDAVRRLTDQVGPMGEALAIRLERAASADELRPLLAMAVQVIANTRGRQAAADYQARFSDL